MLLIKLKAVMALAVLGLSSGLSAYTDMPPQVATRQLQIAISGHITPKCSLLVPGSTALFFGDILDNRNGSAADTALEVPFTLECNSPYTATLTSRNGGLAFDGAGVTNFANLIGYAARVNLTSGAGGMSLTCVSSQMRGDMDAPANGLCRTHSGNSDLSPGDGKMTLTIRGGGLPLLRGTYSDELVLLVSPDIGG